MPNHNNNNISYLWIETKTAQFLLTGLIGFLLYFYSQAAFSQPGQNLFIGNAKALSLGNAVTADPPGIDAIHFNPAGLARLKGRQYQAKFILGTVDLEAEFTPSQSYNDLLDTLGITDSVSNRKSEIEGISIVLPGQGLTHLPFIVAPLGGLSFQPDNSNFVFATAAYSPLIGGVYRAPDDPGQFSYTDASATRITYFSPSIGVELNERVSVGGSIGVSYVGVGADVDVRFPNILAAGGEGFRQLFCQALGFATFPCAGSLNTVDSVANIDLVLEEYMSTTFNLGLLWDINDWLTWGLTYQSSVTDSLEGDVTIEYAPGIQDFFASVPGLAALFPDFNYTKETVKSKLDLDYPQHFATGVSMQLLPRWKLNVDAKWTDTSAWDEWVVEFDETVDVLALLSLPLSVIGVSEVRGNSIVIPRGYKSVWNFSFGGEYQYSDQLVLRAGYEHRPSHIPDDKLDFIVPVADIDVFSVGAGYKWDQDTVVDIAVGLVQSKYSIEPNSSTNFNSEEIDNFVYNPYLGQQGDIKLTALLFMLSYQTTW
ncbi:MAG: outer membrane protein transport protein [Pseudomonadota bacterium]